MLLGKASDGESEDEGCLGGGATVIICNSPDCFYREDRKCTKEETVVNFEVKEGKYTILRCLSHRYRDGKEYAWCVSCDGKVPVDEIRGGVCSYCRETMRFLKK